MLKSTLPVDLGFLSTMPTDRIVRLAKLADELGYETAWMAELYHARSCTLQAMAVAGATKRIKVGLGIVNPYTRHPALIAMEAATLHEASGWRLVLGLGAGKSVIMKHGIKDPKPVAAIRESVDIIRRLLDGQRLVYDGKAFTLATPGSYLSLPRLSSRIPIYIGAMGPQLFKLTGEVADGLLFSVMTSAAYIHQAMKKLEEGIKVAGRDPNQVDVRALIIYSIAKDSAAAKEAAKEMVAAYLGRLSSVGLERIRMAGIDESEVIRIEEPIREALAVGDVSRAASHITDRMVDLLAVAGEPEECVKGLGRLMKAGIRVPVLYGVLGPDPEEALRLSMQEVAPSLT